MTRREFEAVVAKIGLSPVPKRLWSKIRNVALLVEDEPDAATRAEEGLADDETLLGLYRGIPNAERDAGYGIGGTLPDTITLYWKPIEEAADGNPQKIRDVIAETIWHEVAHYFGLEHDTIDAL